MVSINVITLLLYLPNSGLASFFGCFVHSTSLPDKPLFFDLNRTNHFLYSEINSSIITICTVTEDDDFSLVGS
jgi:hypothetical protein